MQFLHSNVSFITHLNMYTETEYGIWKRHAVVDNTDKIADYYASWELGWGETALKGDCEIIKLRFLKAPAS